MSTGCCRTGVFGQGYYGVRAYSGGGGFTGIYALSNGGSYAGYFVGNVHVTGLLSKAALSFKIDHPLDPENKYLSHSGVESPDMANLYQGSAVLDANGEAWVELPDWFEALNTDLHYQLTTIGGYAPVYIATEVSGNRFSIAGGTPGLKVSWQITGVRQDAYAVANPLPIEEVKAAEDQGRYLNPEAFGLPASEGTGYVEPASDEPPPEPDPGP